MDGRGVFLLAAASCLTGCAFERTGPALHDSQSIERDNSELVRVNLDMAAGTLRVAGGTDKLAAAGFQYNVASWKPEVRYSSGREIPEELKVANSGGAFDLQDLREFVNLRVVGRTALHDSSAARRADRTETGWKTSRRLFSIDSKQLNVSDRRPAKPLFVGSTPIRASKFLADFGWADAALSCLSGQPNSPARPAIAPLAMFQAKLGR